MKSPSIEGLVCYADAPVESFHDPDHHIGFPIVKSKNESPYAALIGLSDV